MKQKPTQTFTSECGKGLIIVDNDMALGSLHDFLLNIKGHIVDRMIAAHKQENEYSESQKENEVNYAQSCE